VWGTVGSIALVPAVVDAVNGVPVIAAGGFADGRGLVAALSLGASGVSMGTRFVATEESLAHPGFKERIARATEDDTVYTTLFDGGWPGAPHRVLRNSTVDAWERAGRPPRGSRPGEDDVIGRLPNGTIVRRYDDLSPVSDLGEGWEPCPQYAGQSAGVVRAVRPAADVIREILADAERIVRGLQS
jgi:nitronate monooxygenase